MALPIRFAAALLLLSAGACQRGPAPADEAAQAPPAPDAAGSPAAAEAPPASPAGAAVYACDDGSALQVRFGAGDATLQWPDGRTETLPRAESASRGGGDVYVGETVSLQRDGARLQVNDGTRTLACDPAPGAATSTAAFAPDNGAAARYACDAGVALSRNEDGSVRAEVPGNPAVRLTRIAGSTPPVYTGGELYLRIEADGAILSQADGSNELRCAAG